MIGRDKMPKMWKAKHTQTLKVGRDWHLVELGGYWAHNILMRHEEE